VRRLEIILGPTAVGKTDYSISRALECRSPVISCDSRQIFRELSIGTAVPSAEQLAAVPHYFIQSHSIHQPYTAGIYEAEALELIERLFAEGHETLVVSGGSMMYIDAVCNGIDDIPTVDDQTRTLMKRRLAEEGLPTLVQELKELDPEHYAVVDKQNPRRVVHALEICHMTGKTYTSFRTNSKKERPFRILKIGLNRPREELYDRINRRVDQMMADGLLEEAKALYPRRHLNALNTVGYKELFDYIDGRWPLEEAVERIKGNTRRYARKQLTWFKKDESIRWFHPDETETIIKYICGKNSCKQ
jgi:tRNA dimethylallyltransferase